MRASDRWRRKFPSHWRPESPRRSPGSPSSRQAALRGALKGRWAVAVSGNLRLTFAFDGEDAIDIDLEDYH